MLAREKKIKEGAIPSMAERNIAIANGRIPFSVGDPVEPIPLSIEITKIGWQILLVMGLMLSPIIISSIVTAVKSHQQ